MFSEYETSSKASNKNNILFLASETTSEESSEPITVQVHQRSAPVLSPRAGSRSSRLSPPGLPKERRFSRCSAIHPTTSTDRIREAFGPKTTLRSLSDALHNIPGTPLSEPNVDKEEVRIPVQTSLDDEIEDSAGGLPIHTKSRDRDSLFFRDGRRRIDLVLVYEEEDVGVGVLTEEQTMRQEMRKEFSKSLEEEGLELELEGKQSSFDQKTFFLKIHVPWKVMTRYAEAMNLKMPIKEGEEKTVEPEKSFFALRKIFELDPNIIAEEPSFYSATHSNDREEQFIVKDRQPYFTSAQRSQIVWQILTRTKYDEGKKAGIRRLINNRTYVAAFPLHEGSYNKDSDDGFVYDRRLLYLEWARPGRWYKKQPLWLIRKYFGDKIALYFVWLGFYTTMLIPAAIVGLLCFLYGLLSMNSKDNIPSKEICDMKVAGNITLCPMCDKVCNYQNLGDSCLFAKITYLFDNPATVFFAIFMSFWATTFLELWKRKQAVVAWEWDLQNVEEDEEPRPEFEASVKTFRMNPVTRRREPFIPAWSKALKFAVTGSMVFFMICVVLSAVLGTIIYRISIVTVIYEGGDILKHHAKIFTSMTAALINLIIIMILTKLYHHIALWLTNKENPRTQTEYEDSYTFKIFLFEFMNFYSSLIYIAFFKGRFFSYPGDIDARSSEFLRLKGDICDPAGCLSELCIQLAIIMVGKQFFNNFLELAYPAVINWWRYHKHRSETKDMNRSYTRWEEDYQLQDPGRLALFEEYLEMVIQYGFVTLFVAAFPLAPLFALLNNVGEIRLDAYKMVTQARRPLAERVEDIGAWYGILQGVTYCAVVSNAFVIAYTSDYIPRMVYQFVYSKSHDLVGYIDSSLSVFNTSDYKEGMGIDKNNFGGKEPETCQYRGYRNGPDHPDDPYGLSPQYWHVFAARLAFVVVFEHIVFALTGIMAYVIPDVPSEVKTQIQRERLLAKEAKYERGSTKTDEYDEILSAIRENNNTSRVSDIIRRTSLDRRQSKYSDIPEPKYERR